MDPADRVLVNDLTVDCILGDLPHEREQAQRVTLDLELEVDTRPAARSDDLADAADYMHAAKIAATTAVEGRFRLVETLAERIAEALLDALPASAVRVRVRKSAALPAAASVGVDIRRRRESS